MDPNPLIHPLGAFPEIAAHRCHLPVDLVPVHVSATPFHRCVYITSGVLGASARDVFMRGCACVFFVCVHEGIVENENRFRETHQQYVLTTTTKHHNPNSIRKISLHRQELSPTGIEAGQVGSEDAS